MGPVVVTAPRTTTLAADYTPAAPRLRTLYARATAGQWRPEEDLDWTVPVEFGAPLPDGSPAARTSFEASPLTRRGRPAWDAYRWEVQSWMVSQFLHGEQGALIVAARQVEEAPDVDSKLCAAMQVADEARHVEVFSRYLRDKIPEAYPMNAALRELIEDILGDDRWDVTALGMQIVVEALAMAAFRLAHSTFHDGLIREITRLVARDEARHVSFGIMSLEGVYAQLTSREFAAREELVLDAASLMRRRFLLEDVWERMDVDRADGTRWSAEDPLMIMYRQAVFAKVVGALVRIGLMTGRVRSGLDGLGLLDFAGRPRRLSRPDGRFSR